MGKSMIISTIALECLEKYRDLVVFFIAPCCVHTDNIYGALPLRSDCLLMGGGTPLPTVDELRGLVHGRQKRILIATEAGARRSLRELAKVVGRRLLVMTDEADWAAQDDSASIQLLERA